MTAQGSAYARFKRAIAAGDSTRAWVAASELPHVNLADALAVLLLQADTERGRYERGVVRWHARLCFEAPRVTARESALSLAALQAFGGPGEGAAANALREMCVDHGLDQVASVIDGWVDRRG